MSGSVIIPSQLLPFLDISRDKTNFPYFKTGTVKLEANSVNIMLLSAYLMTISHEYNPAWLMPTFLCSSGEG